MRASAHRERGFTLIELMIVVVVAAVLAAFAYPSFQNQVAKTRRSDAKRSLLEIVNREATFRANCSTYTVNVATASGCCGAGCGLGLAVADSTQGYYTLSVAAGAVGITNSYTARATPKAGGPQVGDRCGSLTLNELGEEGVVGAATGVTAADCW